MVHAWYATGHTGSHAGAGDVGVPIGGVGLALGDHVFGGSIPVHLLQYRAEDFGLYLGNARQLQRGVVSLLSGMVRAIQPSPSLAPAFTSSVRLVAYFRQRT